VKGPAAKRVGLVLAAGCALTAGYLVAGTSGLIASAIALTGLGMLAIRATLPTAQPAANAPPARRWPFRPRLRQAEVDARQFPSYRAISSALAWSQTSARHYDSVTRPLLARLLAAGLAERYGPGHDPALARAFMGERLWPLVDPGRPGSRDSFAPGPDPAVLHEIADRLEDLWRRR
jgi:hypothetical protein